MLNTIFGVIGWVGTVLVFAGVAIRLFRPQWDQYAYYAAVAGLVCVVVYTLSQWRDIVRSFGKREARYSAGGQTWNYILTVVRYEKRTGPGDAMIDTFLIEMQEQGGGGHRSVSRWWISPADKYAIRFDFSDGTGKANRAVVTSVTR